MALATKFMFRILTEGGDTSFVADDCHGFDVGVAGRSGPERSSV